MISVTPVLRFALLLVRPGMLVLMAPGFGGAYAPARVKIGLIAFIAFALLPLAAVPTRRCNGAAARRS